MSTDNREIVSVTELSRHIDSFGKGDAGHVKLPAERESWRSVLLTCSSVQVAMGVSAFLIEIIFLAKGAAMLGEPLQHNAAGVWIGALCIFTGVWGIYCSFLKSSTPKWKQKCLAVAVINLCSVIIISIGLMVIFLLDPSWQKISSNAVSRAQVSSIILMWHMRAYSIMANSTLALLAAVVQFAVLVKTFSTCFVSAYRVDDVANVNGTILANASEGQSVTSGRSRKVHFAIPSPLIIASSSPIWHSTLWGCGAVHIASSLAVLLAELTVLWSSASHMQRLIFPTCIGVWTGVTLFTCGVIAMVTASLQAPALSRQKWLSSTLCANLAGLLVCLVAILLSLEGENPQRNGSQNTTISMSRSLTQQSQQYKTSVLIYYATKDGIIITQCILSICITVAQIFLSLKEMRRYSKFISTETETD